MTSGSGPRTAHNGNASSSAVGPPVGRPTAMNDEHRFPRLLGHITAGCARFGMLLEPGGPLRAVTRYRCAEHPTLWDALARYLSEHAPAAPREAALGVTCEVSGDRVTPQHAAWAFSIARLKQRLGVQRLRVLNDFSALAHSLPALGRAELRRDGGGLEVNGATMALLCPAAGLRVGGLLPPAVLVGEGGQVTLSSFDRDEMAVLQWLHRSFDHVSAERVLSAPGLENLHQAVCALGGWRRDSLSPKQVVELALANSDPACVSALAMFCSLLGNVAGNLALTLGARGGLFIGGDIVPGLGEAFARSKFRERFEAKGKFSNYLNAVPTFVVHADVTPALVGASRALDLPLAREAAEAAVAH